MEHQAAKSRAIPSLDGLRAFSVIAVVLGHTRSAFLDRIPLNSSFRNGNQGVAVFFVISGFLITHLLMKEQSRTGAIDLKRFYMRRTFRIFPPFYVFLLVVGILGAFHLVEVTGGRLLAAATYTWNYVFLPPSWTLGHCWSLSLEEQFYLLWPACMAFLSRRNAILTTVLILLLSPFIRMLTYFLLPTARTHMDMMLHTHLDTIMMGCLLALMLESDIGQEIKKRALHWTVPLLAVVFLLAVDTPAENRWKGMYQMTIGISLENIAIAGLLLYVVFRHESWLGRLLNLKPLRYLGMISYSVYLWQQLFTGPYTHLFPLNLLFILACATASYFVIERPSFWVRDRVQRWVLPRYASAPTVVAQD